MPSPPVFVFRLWSSLFAAVASASCLVAVSSLGSSWPSSPLLLDPTGLSLWAAWNLCIPLLWDQGPIPMNGTHKPSVVCSCHLHLLPLNPLPFWATPNPLGLLFMFLCICMYCVLPFSLYLVFLGNSHSSFETRLPRRPLCHDESNYQWRVLAVRQSPL